MGPSSSAREAKANLTLVSSEEGGQGDSSPLPPGEAANVVLLARDPLLIELLGYTSRENHVIWRAEDPGHATDLLFSAKRGVLLIDAGLTTHDTPSIVDNVHRQFPKLPIIVIGRQDDEAELGERISDGRVFRFLHKPFSARRIKNFLNVAAQRTPDMPPPRPRDRRPLWKRVQFRRPRLDLPNIVIERFQRNTVALLAGALFAGTLTWLTLARPWEAWTLPAVIAKQDQGMSPQVRESEVARLLEAAQLAQDEGRLVAPEGANAIELYRWVLLLDPENGGARAGLAATADRLIRAVEPSLKAGDVAGAAGALDAARSADPAHPAIPAYADKLQAELDRARAPRIPERLRQPSGD
jgi:hypothetical protein